MQPGATGAVRPKRKKKKKQAATFPPAPVLPQQPIQPVVAPNFAAQVPQPIPPLVQYAPTEQVSSPSLAPQSSDAVTQGAHATVEQVKASKPGKCWKCAVDTDAAKDCTAIHLEIAEAFCFCHWQWDGGDHLYPVA
jgi:hypothetical protein